MSCEFTRREFLWATSRLAAGTLSTSALYGLGERSADGEPSIGAVVETESGKVRGTVHRGIHVFKGIPYGASTGGPNRFMPPKKRAPWRGVRDAFRFGHQAPQNMHFTPVLAPQANPEEGFDEDCLVLNVWTPGPNDDRRRPVMFWCHGGGFAQESGSWPWIDGEALARRGDVVVITINHRLNVFGYLYLGDIGGEKYAASGNAGMLDLVAGLRWVRDNIAQFGGDPSNVMIFGESGGGAKVCTLLAMPSAHGLFHRAAIESGSWLRCLSREEADRSARAFLRELGITRERIDVLQRLPMWRLLEVRAGSLQPIPSRRGTLRLGFSPVVDGKIIPANPFDPVATPLAANVPIIVGCNEFEATLFYLQDKSAFSLEDAGLHERVAEMVGEGAAAKLIGVYEQAHPGDSPSDIFFRIATHRLVRRDTITLAERKFAQGGAPVYMYYFTWRSPALNGRLRSPHTVEIPFVFDNAGVPTVMTRAPGVKPLAAKTSSAWIAFARSGNPNHPGLPSWPAYTTGARATMVFNNTCQVVDDPGGAERMAWADI